VPIVGQADDLFLLGLVLRRVAGEVTMSRVRDHWSSTASGLRTASRVFGLPPHC